MSQKISLREYIQNRRKELDAFEAHWVSQSEINPEDWPGELDEGEWFEQEVAFCESGGLPCD